MSAFGAAEVGNGSSHSLFGKRVLAWMNPYEIEVTL